MNDFERYQQEFDNHALHQMLGITLVEQRPGFGKICLTLTDKTPTGIGGSVHGGILAAMVDIAMLVAVFAELSADDKPAGTADLSISYLRQAHGDHIYAEATLVKKGRQLSMIEVSIIDDESRLCARGRTLYAFRP